MYAAYLDRASNVSYIKIFKTNNKEFGECTDTKLLFCVAFLAPL